MFVQEHGLFGSENGSFGVASHGRYQCAHKILPQRRVPLQRESCVSIQQSFYKDCEHQRRRSRNESA